ncbi:hypothetical protein PUW25_25890 (plasmid) [Paenibacillus urinalis]|uniref:Uncharacterized protein n=1 Tax=Paenibacillus urinalis TaxID=521520 RepID=A0ABY7XHR4_9BACL|nr:hypothetical protein [Paenibacillus urinalis]WDI05244.1 hypothetical protein PUW25_25890 [Paenibacillus urinalis]
MSKEKKLLYRVYGQSNNTTAKVSVDKEMTLEECKSAAANEVFKTTYHQLDKLVALPIGTKDDYDRGIILFCPRCGGTC